MSHGVHVIGGAFPANELILSEAPLIVLAKRARERDSGVGIARVNDRRSC
jgi:hypothetical protein